MPPLLGEPIVHYSIATINRNIEGDIKINGHLFTDCSPFARLWNEGNVIATHSSPPPRRERSCYELVGGVVLIKFRIKATQLHFLICILKGPNVC